MSCTESCGHSEICKQEKERNRAASVDVRSLLSISIWQAQALDESAAGWDTPPRLLFLRLATGRSLLKTKLFQNSGVSCCIQKGKTREGSHITYLFQFSMVLKKLVVRLQLVHFVNSKKTTMLRSALQVSLGKDGLKG